MALQCKENLSNSEDRKLRAKYTSRLTEKLRAIRKSRKMTQEELAEKASLHPAYVGHLELGRYHPTVYVMWKVAKALGVSMSELTDA